MKSNRHDSTFTFGRHDPLAYAVAEALIEQDPDNQCDYTIRYVREWYHADSLAETIRTSDPSNINAPAADALKWVMAHGFRFVDIVRHRKPVGKPIDEIEFPDDPNHWKRTRVAYECGHCGTQFDMNTYHDHMKESERCRRAEREYCIANTFPYIDLRGYRTPAGAAKALHDKLVELGYNEARLLSPSESDEAGTGKCWRVILEGGPFEWAVEYSLSGASSNRYWYTEPHFSFDLCFVR